MARLCSKLPKTTAQYSKTYKISFQPVKSAAEHFMHLFPCAGIGEKNILEAVTR